MGMKFQTQKKMAYIELRRRRMSLGQCFLLIAMFTGFCFLSVNLKSADLSFRGFLLGYDEKNSSFSVIGGEISGIERSSSPTNSPCATVEQMGESFVQGFAEESLRVKQIIQDHFAVHGAANVRQMPSAQFCKQGFVLGKASEAGFGNEMYKILTAATLSIMLNRSLIIGQTRERFPFGDYIQYTNHSFTLKEVKHLWQQNDCVGRYKKHLTMRVDDFERPEETNVLCSDWRKWKQPIIWFKGTTDAVAIQFFLKNIHSEMRDAATVLLGQPERIQHRPNIFGEMMHFVISPSQAVKDAVNWVLVDGLDPDVTLHMRMLMNSPVRAVKAALSCIKKALQLHDLWHRDSKPQVVLVSDTPSILTDIKQNLKEFAEVLYFDYKLFRGNNVSGLMDGTLNQPLEFRRKDWGPAPRWVAFVDFFLASRAKHAVITGAHRRVGTTYAQLVAALAAAYQLDQGYPATSNFSFLSSFHSNLLTNGLANQIGWGHVWNRFAGPLSCRHQPNQCALTPLLPLAWWDGMWQSPIARDIHRLKAYGVLLTDSGKVNESYLRSFCERRKKTKHIITIYSQCKTSRCH